MSLLPDPNMDVDTDYILPVKSTCWITVRQFSVYLSHRSTAMQIEIYENGEETDSPLYEMNYPFNQED